MTNIDLRFPPALDVENEEERNASVELSKRYVFVSSITRVQIYSGSHCYASCRTKRMSIEVGPSSFASRKKKSRTKKSP